MNRQLRLLLIGLILSILYVPIFIVVGLVTAIASPESVPTMVHFVTITLVVTLIMMGSFMLWRIRGVYRLESLLTLGFTLISFTLLSYVSYRLFGNPLATVLFCFVPFSWLFSSFLFEDYGLAIIPPLITFNVIVFLAFIAEDTVLYLQVAIIPLALLIIISTIITMFANLRKETLAMPLLRGSRMRLLIALVAGIIMSLVVVSGLTATFAHENQVLLMQFIAFIVVIPSAIALITMIFDLMDGKQRDASTQSTIIVGFVLLVSIAMIVYASYKMFDNALASAFFILPLVCWTFFVMYIDGLGISVTPPLFTMTIVGFLAFIADDTILFLQVSMVPIWIVSSLSLVTMIVVYRQELPEARRRERIRQVQLRKEREAHPVSGRLGSLMSRTAPISRLSLSRSRRDVHDNRSYTDLKQRVQTKMIVELELLSIQNLSRDEIRRAIEELFNTILAEENMVLSRAERQRLFDAIVSDILGYGPLEVLLADESISHIMVNGPKSVFVQRRGKITLANVTFENEDHLRRTLERATVPTGRDFDDESPMTTATLPHGGHRLNIIARPASLVGISVVIEKPEYDPILSMQDLIRFGWITEQVAELLREAVLAGLNIVICGGVRGDKRLLATAIIQSVSEKRHVVLIERMARQSQLEHVVTLQSQPPHHDTPKPASELLCSAFALDAQVVAFDRDTDCEMVYVSPEFDNLPQSSVLGLMDAGTPQDCIERLEILAQGKLCSDEPLHRIHARIVERIDLIVQWEVLRDGSRRVINISEVQGTDENGIKLATIFEFEQTGFEIGKVIGRIRPTGVKPNCLPRLTEHITNPTDFEEMFITLEERHLLHLSPMQLRFHKLRERFRTRDYDLGWRPRRGGWNRRRGRNLVDERLRAMRLDDFEGFLEE